MYTKKVNFSNSIIPALIFHHNCGKFVYVCFLTLSPFGALPGEDPGSPFFPLENKWQKQRKRFVWTPRALTPQPALSSKPPEIIKQREEPPQNHSQSPPHTHAGDLCTTFILFTTMKVHKTHTPEHGTHKNTHNLILVYSPSFTIQKHSLLNHMKDLPLPAGLLLSSDKSVCLCAFVCMSGDRMMSITETQSNADSSWSDGKCGCVALYLQPWRTRSTGLAVWSWGSLQKTTNK